MNYDNWKSLKRSAAGLFLDPQNPRIPPATKPFSQPDLLTELALHDDVYELAKNIAANGFFPNEPLVAIKESYGLVIVEGNRRLAACKLLLQPELAPPSLISRFKSLSGGFDLNLLKRVPVLLAPSREATIPLIIARHTATQIATWKPAMQAHFYHSLVQQGLTIEEVADKFHLPAGDIKGALISHNLYTMACRLDLPESVSQVVKDPRKFPLTTLGRIFETPAGRDFFGLQFADDGRVVGSIAADEFKKGFTKAVSDVAGGTVDSRTLNSPDEIQNYLNGYSATEKPDLKKTGSFDSTTFLASGVRAPSRVPPRRKTKQVPTLAPKGLIPRTVVCRVSNRRVQSLFEELRKLSPAAFPNACTFAFRCFLELSVFCFLDTKGEIAKMKAEAQAEIAKYNAKLPPAKPRRTLPPNWTPELNEMLKWIADTKKGVIPPGHIAKALSQAIHDEKDLISMNLVVHNPAYPASERRLRESWGRLEEFLKLILS